MVGEVLHAVLSAWLFVGKIVADVKEGIRVHVICEVKKGQIKRLCAKMVDVVFSRV